MSPVLRALLPLVLGGALLAIGPSQVFAQSDDEDDEVETEPSGEDDDGEIRLRPPTAEPIRGYGTGSTAGAGAGDEEDEDYDDEEDLDDEDLEEEDEDEDAEEEEEEEDDELPDPGAADRRLELSTADPTVEPWTSPQTVFEVHGYMRMRGEFQDQFSLGRGGYPFEIFIPRDDLQVHAPSAMSSAGEPIIPGGCSGARRTTTMDGRQIWDESGLCNQRALAFANMRLRIEPTIHLSDDVRVHMQLDVLDNVVMGSTPDGFFYSNGSYQLNPGMVDVDATPTTTYVPLRALSDTQVPPQYGFNSWRDSIVVRRAWAEVRNRGLGELRFGRMGNHWGLGILANGGTGIDSDFQTDVDRIMAITRLVGFYFFGAWDFAGEGYIYDDPARMRVPFDQSRLDDVDQFTFGVARRSSPEEQRAALARGDVVLNGGIYLQYRTQNLTTEGTADPLSGGARAPTYFRRGFESYTPDIWVQFLWERLRLEAEAVMVIGTIDNIRTDGFGDDGTPGNSLIGTNTLLQFGLAFEAEYHLLNDQLGIYFNAGYASGDADSEGLTPASSRRGLGYQAQIAGEPTDRNLTAFAFHPNYRVDLIFWRTMMRGIGSAYYFRPGLSYDFIRNSFGQLLGARADVVWSRAAQPIQTWGNGPDLGVEIDAQVYYRSEDGPDFLDGFYASLQYGIFFPLDGLGLLQSDLESGQASGIPWLGGQNAQTLRLILGVQY